MFSELSNVQILIVVAIALGIMALCGAFYAIGFINGRGGAR